MTKEQIIKSARMLGKTNSSLKYLVMKIGHDTKDQTIIDWLKSMHLVCDRFCEQCGDCVICFVGECSKSIDGEHT